MRILHVIATSDPKDGGPIEAVRQGVEAFLARGHEVELVTLDDPEADHVHAFPVPVHAMPGWIRRYGYTPQLARWIEANAHRFDAAVVHGLWNHASIGGWQGLSRARLPYVVFVHGMMSPWFKEQFPLKHIAKQIFWWLWQGKVLRDAKAALFTCEQEQRLARGVFHGPSFTERVVAFGTAPPPPAQSQDEKTFRRLIQNLDDRPYLLFLGRLHPVKGCDLLIKAFAAIADQHPELDLVVAGPDQKNLKASLQALAHDAGVADRIHWPGMVVGTEKYGAYRGATAFVLPSHQENFGIVVAEALSCGCPVLISDKVNIWQEVEASGAGLVAPDTLAGAEDLLRRFLALDADEQAAMRRAAPRAFADKFSIDAAAEDLLRTLEELRPAMRPAPSARA